MQTIPRFESTAPTPAVPVLAARELKDNAQLAANFLPEDFALFNRLISGPQAAGRC